MKIVLIGGHLSPALAIYESLKKEDVLYIGRKYALEGDNSLSLEYRIINSLDINFAEIKTGRLQRRFTRHTLSSFLKTPFGLWQSYKILKDFQPDIVVGFGGYLSVPVVFAASLQKIPVVLHEQTLEAGLANKMLSRFAKKICISFSSSLLFFPKEKTILTGNPVRKEIINASRHTKSKERSIPPTIYVTGGSLGSHSINLLIENSIINLLSFAKVIHQTGDAKNFNDFDRLSKLKQKMPKTLQERYRLFKFLSPDKIGEVLVNSDLIISRAGINTVSELIYLQKPALFIPLPYSQRNEQVKNALMAKEQGIAEVFDEEGSVDNFLNIVKNMLSNLDNYKNIQTCLEKANPAEKIIKVIKEAARSDYL